jgi:WD40 repeat protein
VWDSQDGSILGKSHCSDWTQRLAWNPVDERLLAAGCHNKGGAYLLEWKPDKKEIVRNQFLKDADVSGVGWSPDGQILATSGLPQKF